MAWGVWGEEPSWEGPARETRAAVRCSAVMRSCGQGSTGSTGEAEEGWAPVESAPEVGRCADTFQSPLRVWSCSRDRCQDDPPPHPRLYSQMQ